MAAVEAQVGKVAAALSVVLDVVRVFDELQHEIDGLVRRYVLGWVQNFGDVS